MKNYEKTNKNREHAVWVGSYHNFVRVFFSKKFVINNFIESI